VMGAGGSRRPQGRVGWASAITGCYNSFVALERQGQGESC